MRRNNNLIEKTSNLLLDMGITNLSLHDAGSGNKFKSSKTQYKLWLYDINDKAEFIAYSGAWEKESMMFFAIQAIKAKQVGKAPCRTQEVKSAFGRTIMGSCSKCGGFGYLPIEQQSSTVVAAGGN